MRELRVLTISYSQSGQIDRVVNSIAGPLREKGIEVKRGRLIPSEPHPFPWPILQFFNQFPETVYEKASPAILVDDAGQEINDCDFDLVILGYQVWFLSPSLPVSSFLNGDAAKRLLKGKRVITVVACRNMWLMAQERMKGHLERLEARLVDNVALTDAGRAALTFLSTPLWVLTGNRGPRFGGLIPRAGVPEHEIADAARFGVAIADHLARDPDRTAPMLTGLGAVKINPMLIQSEKAGRRSFRAWGALLLWIGHRSSLARRLVLCLFIAFLILLILTVVPAVALLKWALRPMMHKKLAEERAFYSQPSGE